MRNKHNSHLPYRIDLLIRIIHRVSRFFFWKVCDRLDNWAFNLEDSYCTCRNCKRRAMEELSAKKA